ncbi:hypothetical protein [Brachyspira murdochii]|uniref:hypothetical protein n=1 Tax=Brachyspira murdochii TaxID=84378 RepID=UPI0012F49251|nr:hypothetical protein [Brachyspira murdochii]
MTITYKNNDLFSIYDNYLKEDNTSVNNMLASAVNDIKKLEKNIHNASKQDIKSIGDILIKLSLAARMHLRQYTDSEKVKDLSFTNRLRYSKDIIDYSLKVIIRYLKNIKNEDINFNSIYLLKNNDVISHSNRVFFTIIKFIKYYNDSINQNIVIDIKNNFKRRYSGYYKSILKRFHINKNISKLEHVYKYGLREILFNEMINISLAAFWHNIINFDISDEYNSMRCYSYLKHFLKYNDDVSLIVGLHNEYYGYGYGIFLNYYNTIINTKPFFKPYYIVSFDYTDSLKLTSLSYFPSKILEIVNLFDNILYSKNDYSNYNDILICIKENYLEREVKIDPIIFDIFSSFVVDTNI